MHVLWKNIICNNCALIDCADTSNYNFHFIFLNFLVCEELREEKMKELGKLQ